MSTTLDVETTIRSYLLLLDDPNKLIDLDKIESLERSVEATSDPIEKLRALADLERAKTVDAAAFEASFVRHAKKWAAANNIPVSSFQRLGVSEATLRSAGMLDDTSASSYAAVGARSRGINADAIRAKILTLNEPFKLIELTSTVGGSPMTVRKAVGDLIDQGQLIRLGPDPTHHGRGRAPIIYQRAETSN